MKKYKLYGEKLKQKHMQSLVSQSKITELTQFCIHGGFDKTKYKPLAEFDKECENIIMIGALDYYSKGKEDPEIEKLLEESLSPNLLKLARMMPTDEEI